MLKLPEPFRKQGQQLCNDGNTTLFFDAYNVDQMLEAYRQGIAAQQAQPEPVNAMLVEALQAAENLEHEALVALSEATYELKVGNTYTTATDTYKANNELIHRLDKILNSQYRDRKRTALTAALAAAQQAQPVCGYDDETGNCTRVNCCKQAQPESHLFELWWAEYMPEAAQEQAFKAWSAAPGSKGVGVEQQAQPEPSEMTTEREAYIAGLESRTHEMRKKIEQLDYELRVARSSQEPVTYTPPKIIDPDAPHPCFN